MPRAISGSEGFDLLLPQVVNVNVPEDKVGDFAKARLSSCRESAMASK